MVIKHNMTAQNAARNYGCSVSQGADSMEKLSSGYRINRAADDAAGLSISEKMRRMVRGLTQASSNAQDGISLLQIADGALHEVHDITQRINELAVKAANGTNSTEDRQAIQNEIDDLIHEVDRVAEATTFNEMPLLDGRFARPEDTTASPYVQTTMQESGMQQYAGNISVDAVIGTGATDKLTQTQLDNVNTILKDSIVPQAVNALLNTFPALQTAANANQVSDQIGLELYGDNSTTLAFVSLRYGTYSDGTIADSSIALNLSVNVNSLAFDGDNLTEASRTALETTIVHEMVHAFMDDTMINGMVGATNGKKDADNAFPGWFKEGMAQAAAGGCSNSNDWVNGGLGLNGNSTEAQIKSAVQSSGNKLSSGTTQSKYGTGYLACMYLGYLAAGSPSSITSATLSNGVNKIFNDLMNGDSLDDIVKTISNGAYTSLSDFENKFGDATSAAFVSDLLNAVGTSGNGGLVAGLTESDLLSNNNATSSVYEADDTQSFVTSSVGTNRNWGSGGSGGSTASSGSTGGGTGGGTGGTGGSGGSSGTARQQGALHLLVGAEADHVIAVYIDDMHAKAIGLDNVSVMDEEKAGETIDACKVALQEISTMRSDIGAYINRLEHTIRNLDNVVENTQAAESRIRDLDMAQEMVAYSINSIIRQAGQAVLSQANTANEAVLSLL